MTRTKNSPRVYRGGGWSNIVPLWVRAASRLALNPASRRNHIGFRTALPGRQPR
jgi:formylglycine-generating enzyme required for sulfatase activity